MYEFRVAAVTTSGSGPLSAPSAPVSTIQNRRNPPVFSALARPGDVRAAPAATAAAAETQGTLATNANATTHKGDSLKLPKLSLFGRQFSSDVDRTKGTDMDSDGGMMTGLTPRFEDDRLIEEAALSFDHTHGRGAKKGPLRPEDARTTTTLGDPVAASVVVAVVADDDDNGGADGEDAAGAVWAGDHDDRDEAAAAVVMLEDGTLVAQEEDDAERVARAERAALAAAAEEKRRTLDAKEGRNLP